MLSKELRIGNYVNSPVLFFNDSVMHVVRAEDIVEQVRIEKSGGIGFKPIPLTDEWIRDFGLPNEWITDFELDKHFSIYLNECGKNIYTFCQFSNRICEVKYVHQLQNLYFSLTGNELSIKN